MLKKIALTVGAVAALAGATASGPGLTPPVSIADIVERSGGKFDKNNNDYDLLLNALLFTGLGDALDEPGDFTVFAPNDFAFIFLARDLGYTQYSERGAWNFLVEQLTTLGGGDPLPLLTQILEYHVAGESLSRTNLRELGKANGTITTLGGGLITVRAGFRLEDLEPSLRDPRLTSPNNVVASNGIIHTINRVLIPLDIP